MDIGDRNAQLLSTAYMVLRPKLGDLADRVTRRATSSEKLQALLLQRGLAGPIIRQQLLDFFTRCLQGPYDDQLLVYLIRVGQQLQHIGLNMRRLLSAARDMLQWSRARLLNDQKDWSEVAPLYDALERLVFSILRGIDGGMEQGRQAELRRAPMLAAQPFLHEDDLPDPVEALNQSVSFLDSNSETAEEAELALWMARQTSNTDETTDVFATHQFQLGSADSLPALPGLPDPASDPTRPG